MFFFCSKVSSRHNSKLRYISKELDFVEFLSSDFFLLSDLNSIYRFEKEEISRLLKAGSMQILMCTGIMVMDKRILYEGDRVKFVTPYQTEEQEEGDITLVEGKWKVITKKFLHADEYELDDRISIKFVCDRVGNGD